MPNRIFKYAKYDGNVHLSCSEPEILLFIFHYVWRSQNDTGVIKVDLKWLKV